MRIALVTIIVADLIGCAWVFLQTPIKKISTPTALAVIEGKYLTADLSAEERRELDSFKRIILSNDKALTDSQSAFQLATLLIGSGLVIQNLALLAYFRPRKRKLSSEQ